MTATPTQSTNRNRRSVRRAVVATLALCTFHCVPTAGAAVTFEGVINGTLGDPVGELSIGFGANGSLRVDGGSSATAPGKMTVGQGNSRDILGELVVTGAGTMMTAGGGGSGESITAGRWLGGSPAGLNARGRIEVSDGARFDVLAALPPELPFTTLAIGRRNGSGELDILSGGKVRVIDDRPNLPGSDRGQSVQIGGSRTDADAGLADSVGVVTVDGVGSSLDVIGVDAAYIIGRGGSGTLNIRNGATASGKSLSLARSTVSRGVLRVEGAGSLLTLRTSPGFEDHDDPGAEFSGFMQIGREAEGIATISDGGEVRLFGAADETFPGFTLGRDESGRGSLLITGAGSRLTIESGATSGVAGRRGIVDVGRNGEGNLEILDGAALVNDPAGVTFVGRNSTANGALIVADASSRLDAGELMLVGTTVNFDTGEVLEARGGSASVSVSGGATVATGRLEIHGDGILAGDGGTIDGDVVLVAGGSISPGGDSAIGTLTLNGTSELAGGVVVLQASLAADGALDFDRLVLNGVSNLSAASTRITLLGELAADPSRLAGVSLSEFFRTGADGGTGFPADALADLAVEFDVPGFIVRTTSEGALAVTSVAAVLAPLLLDL